MRAHAADADGHIVWIGGSGRPATTIRIRPAGHAAAAREAARVWAGRDAAVLI